MQYRSTAVLPCKSRPKARLIPPCASSAPYQGCASGTVHSMCDAEHGVVRALMLLLSTYEYLRRASATCPIRQLSHVTFATRYLPHRTCKGRASLMSCLELHHLLLPFHYTQPFRTAAHPCISRPDSGRRPVLSIVPRHIATVPSDL